MNPKATIAAVIAAAGIGSGVTAIATSTSPAPTVANGSMRLESHPPYCHCFVNGQRDVKRHCQDASGMTGADFDAAWARCEGK